MFWYKWPSWITELLGGLLLASVWMLFADAHVAVAACLAIVTSVVYEASFDPNGWSWKDVGQRTVGIVLGLVILHAFFKP